MNKRAPMLTLVVVLMVVSVALPALAQEEAEKATLGERIDARGLCRYDEAANRYTSFEEIPLSLIGEEARPGDRPAEGFAGCEALNRVLADVEADNVPPDVPDTVDVRLEETPIPAEPDDRVPSPSREGEPSPLTTVSETAPPEAPSGSGVDQEVEDPLARDAEWYAQEMGISLEEAIRRLELQRPAGELGAELETNEPDTFAGFWIQHEPEYRFVALFTRDGEETIRPYIEGEPWADLVEVRNGADATLEELKAEQAEAGRIVDDLGISTNSSINVQENRIELYVTDRARLEAALQDAGLRLPEHVAVIQVERLAEPAAGAAPGGEDPGGNAVPGSEEYSNLSSNPAGNSAGDPGDSPSGSNPGNGSGEPNRGGTVVKGGGTIGNAVSGISGLLPATGGLPLAVLGTGVALIGGGFLVRKIAR